MNIYLSKYYNLINKERNIYQLATLHHQNRKEVKSYIDILQEPNTSNELKLDGENLIGLKKYKIQNNVPDFTQKDIFSKDWKRLNKQFLNYHKSLTVYTLMNSSPIINYLSIKSEIGLMKNIKVLDVGGGTGHTFVSFFQFPETIDYFLIDPNLRLLHDQFIRIYPKLGYLKMAHILANAEELPIKRNSFDLVLSIESIDHLNNYKEFISESYRVLKDGGKLFLASHLDVPVSKDDSTTIYEKFFSNTFFERLSRFLFFRRHKVGDDDHTLHLKDEKPLEKELEKNGFKILKKHLFKSYFFFVAEK